MAVVVVSALLFAVVSVQEEKKLSSSTVSVLTGRIYQRTPASAYNQILPLFAWIQWWSSHRTDAVYRSQMKTPRTYSLRTTTARPEAQNRTPISSAVGTSCWSSTW